MYIFKLLSDFWANFWDVKYRWHWDMDGDGYRACGNGSRSRDIDTISKSLVTCAECREVLLLQGYFGPYYDH